MKRILTSATLLLVALVGCKKNDLVPGKTPVVAVDFEIPADSVKLNPYGFAPLSALVNFTSPVAGKTVIIVKGKNGPTSDVENVFNDEGLSHSIPVIGLYGNFANAVDIRLINNNGDTVAKSSINIQTGALPANLKTSIVADVVPSGSEEPGLNLVSNLSVGTPLVRNPGSPQIPLMVDNYGDVRWLLDYSTHPDLNALFYDNGIKRLRNGDFYFGDWWSNRIWEVDLLGKVINSFDLSTTDYVFHHDIDEMPNGNLIVSVTKKGSTHKDGSPTLEDFVIEIDRQTHDVKTVWDLKESLEEDRKATIDPLYNYSDWHHTNSILYDSTDNTIIVSGRNQGVAKLTFDNKVKWIMAPHRGWTTNGRGEDLTPFLLTPLDAAGNKITDTAVLSGSANHPDFEWTWFQHSVIAMPNGDLMLFDNGSVRNYDPSAPKYSRAVEYKIDPVNMTIQQKWQYGKERGLETFSNIVSSVQYLPESNHVIFAPGYQVINAQGQGGKIVEVDYDTKQVISQLSLSAPNLWGFHRAKRISAYPH